MTRGLSTAVCLATALSAVATTASAQTSLEKRVTVDVTEVAPRQVMELLAQAVGCEIADGPDSDPLQPVKKLLGLQHRGCRFFVDPAVTQPLTMRVVNVPISSVLPMICQSIPCEYRFDGTNVWLKPLSESRKRMTSAMEDYFRKLESRLPQNMRFQAVSLTAVLQAIGKASGLELRPYKGEGDRKVTIDVSGRTVNEALEAIIRQIDGEGVVMIRSWQGSMAQYRIVDKRREP